MRLLTFVHTERVCVPIDPDHCDDFDPFSVPTLQKLCKELDEYHVANGDTTDKRMAGKAKKNGTIYFMPAPQLNDNLRAPLPNEDLLILFAQIMKRLP